MNKKTKTKKEFPEEPNVIKKTDVTLRESEERFRNLMEYIPGVSIQGYRCDGTVVYWNKASEEVYGYTAREAVGKYLGDLIIPPDLKPLFKKSLQEGKKVKKSGEFLPPGELMLLHKEGHLVPVYSIHTAIRVEGEDPLLFCFDLDISERKKAEEDLRRRDAILEAVSLGAEQFLKRVYGEENIQKVIEGLGEAAEVSRVYIFENHPGQDGELLTSQRYEWVAEGIEPQADNPDLLDFPWQGGGMERWEEKLSKNEVISGQVREFPESERTILMPQDIISIVVVPITVKNRWWGFIGFDECGRERQWTSAEVDALKTAAGIIGAALERKQLEEKLRESGERLELAVTGTNLGLWDDNLVTGETVFNRQYTEMLGYEPGEIEPEDRAWEKMVHPDDLPRVLKAQNECFNGKIPLYEAEFRMRTKSGEWKWIQSAGKVAEWDDAGKPLRVIGTNRDITIRKKAEAALEQEKSKFEEHSHILNIMTGQMMDMVYYKDKNFRYLFSSKPHCERILKCSPEECIGLTDVEIAQRYRQSGHEQQFGEICFNSDQQTRDGGKPSQFLETAKVDGEEISLEVYKTPLYDENGEFAGIVGCSRDTTKRKKVEEAIERAKREWEKTFDTIPDLIMIVDDRCRIVRANRAVADKLGIPITEVPGKVCYQAVHGTDAPPDFCPLAKLLKDGREHTVEVRLDHLDGDYMITTTPLRNREGRVTGAVHVARDITNLKEAEEALRESEERFRAIFDTAQDSIFIKDRTLKYTQVNPAMEKLFGLPASKLIGRTDEDLFGERAGVHIREVDSRVLGGEIINEEHTKAVKGVPYTFHVIKVPMRDSSGKIIGLCGISRNITERKRAEHALRESEERLELAVTATNLGMWDDNLVTGETVLNRQYTKMLGYEPGELKLDARSWEKLVHPDDLPRVLKARNEYLEGKTPLYEVEFRMRTKTREWKWILAVGSCFGQDKDGKPLRMIGTHRDITERKRAEEALRESEERMELAISGAKLGLWDQDIATGKDVHNRQWAEMLGYTLEEIELENITWENLLHPEDFLPALKKENEHLAGKTPFYEAEFRMRTRTGGWKWIQSAGRVSEWDDAGKPLRMLGTHRDITERKEMEESLRESEKRLELAVTGTNLGLWDEDVVTGKSVRNRQWFEMLGYGPEDVEMRTDSWKDLIHPDDAQMVMKKYDEHLAGKSTYYEVEYRIRCKSGEWRWIQGAGKVSKRDDEGKPLRVIGTHRDITERKRAEEALRESEERLEMAVTGTKLGLWDWNIITDENIFNRQWAEMLGYSLEEIELKTGSWRNLVHPDDLPRTMRILNEHFEGNIPFYEVEFRMRTKTGEWEWIQSVGRIFEWNEKGKPLRMIGTHRDITERKLAEARLEEYSGKLEEMVDDRTAELRSVVGSMAGREVRMGELKDVIKQLRKQIEEAGMDPMADDPLLGEG